MKLQEHKKSLTRFTILEIIFQVAFILIVTYFVDYLGYKFIVVTIPVSIIAFIVRYLINKYWVFEE